MRAAVGKNMYVMCSDNINLAQQFFLLPLKFFNTKILIHNLAHTTSNFKCYFPPTSNSQIYISDYSPRSEVQVFKVVRTGSSTWYWKGEAWPHSIAQLFLNEEWTERAHAKGRNCELFLIVVWAEVVLVCYSEAVVYILWKKPNESL